MNAKQQKENDRAHAIATLRAMLKPGDRVSCDVVHVSRSGMSRTLTAHVAMVGKDRRAYVEDVSGLVADAIGARWDSRRGGFIMGGCGMDMRFAAVYNLGRVLFPDGFGVEGMRADGRKVRPRTRTHARRLVKDGATFRGRNGDACGWDNDGGYALDYR